ncbi:MAG: NUDIX domain-containing protein [Phycisphaerales bacterium]|jgi:NADH pyrophosphatase NudC (nudix superfamily)
MKLFDYCPSCGSSDIFFDDIKKFSCKACSFTFFQNVAAAVAAMLEYEQKIILIKRSKEPGRGKLDFPGGFVDPEETVEEAVRREISEELSINVGTLKYVGSYPNIYEYKGVRYRTCDLFFYSKIDALPATVDKAEIEEFVLMNPSEVPDDKIAFKSTRIGLDLLGQNL